MQEFHFLVFYSTKRNANKDLLLLMALSARALLMYRLFSLHFSSLSLRGLSGGKGVKVRQCS